MADEEQTQPNPSPSNQGEGHTNKQATGQEDIEKNKGLAIIAYFWILFIVPLVAARDSKFAMFHANQGLNLFLTAVAVGFVWIIPILGWIVGFFGGIFVFVLWIMGILNAARGEMKPLPVIGGWQLIK